MKSKLRRIVAALGLSSLLAAAQGMPTASVQMQLYQQRSVLKLISQHVEQADKTRFEALRNSLEGAIQALASSGPMHASTQNKIKDFVIRSRHSGDLFTQILSEKTRGHIIRFVGLTENLAVTTGLDELPRSQVTAAVAAQLHSVLLSFDKSLVEEEVKAEARSLHPRIGRLIAKARTEGDSSGVMNEGRQLFKDLAMVSAHLSERIGASAIFDIAFEIEQLREYYAAFSGQGGEAVK